MMWGIMDGAETMPDWMDREKTLLIAKDGCIGNTYQFRPIACLNTSYKLLTGVLAATLSEHVFGSAILPTEQKAFRKVESGCLDVLTIDTAIVEEAKKDRSNLSVAWVDYSKAYDLVPHRWVSEMMWTVRAPRPIRALLRKIMEIWTADLCLWTVERPKHILMVMKSDVFQGHSLSPFLFCPCIPPLSEVVKATGEFHSTHQSEPVTHLMFVDDQKVYVKGQTELEDAINVVESVSGAMGMELGLKKCGAAHMIQGAVVMAGAGPLKSGAEEPRTREMRGLLLFGGATEVRSRSPED